MIRAQWPPHDNCKGTDSRPPIQTMTNTTSDVSEDRVPEGLGPASRWRIVVLKHVAAAHAVAGAVGSIIGRVNLLLPPLVATPVLVFMSCPGTRALFRDRDVEAGSAPRRRRPWWLLSVQCLAGLLVIILAVGLIMLFSLGPMVEVVLLNANLCLARL